VEGLIMRFDLTFYPFVSVLLILLALLVCRFWLGGKSSPAESKPPRRKRELKPFAGLTRKPECEAVSSQFGLNRRSPACFHPA
jgi:hypothetical protein